MRKEMASIRDVIAIGKATDANGNVVYVGPQLKTMLENTEKNLETKIKYNALWTACFIYGGLILTVPVIFNLFFKGG